MGNDEQGTTVIPPAWHDQVSLDSQHKTSNANIFRSTSVLAQELLSTNHFSAPSPLPMSESTGQQVGSQGGFLNPHDLEGPRGATNVLTNVEDSAPKAIQPLNTSWSLADLIGISQDGPHPSPSLSLGCVSSITRKDECQNLPSTKLDEPYPPQTATEEPTWMRMLKAEMESSLPAHFTQRSHPPSAPLSPNIAEATAGTDRRSSSQSVPVQLRENDLSGSVMRGAVKPTDPSSLLQSAVQSMRDLYAQLILTKGTMSGHANPGAVTGGVTTTQQEKRDGIPYHVNTELEWLPFLPTLDYDKAQASGTVEPLFSQPRGEEFSLEKSALSTRSSTLSSESKNFLLKPLADDLFAVEQDENFVWATGEGDTPRLDQQRRRARSTSCVSTPMRRSSTGKSVRSLPSVRPWACDTCGRAFLRKSNLRQHLDTHSVPSKRPFACPLPGCTFQFSRRNDCHRHIHKQHVARMPLTEDVYNVIRAAYPTFVFS